MKTSSVTFYHQPKLLLEIRLPIKDDFYTYWGKPIYGGVFGAGEYALVGVVDPRYTLPTVFYLVLHARSGMPLTDHEHQTKAEAIGAARLVLKTCDRAKLYAVISKVLAEAQALDQRIADEMKSIRERERQAERDSTCKTRDKAGYVYLVRCDDRYKIGKAIDVESRLRSMMLPSKPEIIASGRFDHPHAVERTLHQEYRHCRENGEWFRLTASEVEAVTKRLQEAREQKPKLQVVS